MRLGQQVKKLRKSLKLTQKQFARRVPGRRLGGVDHTFIGKIERGHSLPSIKMLTRMAKTYGVPVGYFFLEDSLVKAVSLNVKEDVRHWLLGNLPAFEEGLRKKIEGSIEKALTGIPH